MSELLVMAKDKTDPDVFLNQCHPKRGDVIVACPDGWKWGTEELKGNKFIVVKVPDMAIREANALTSPPPGDRRTDPMLNFRAFFLDLNLLSVTTGLVSLQSTSTQIGLVKTARAVVPNPFVVG